MAARAGDMVHIPGGRAHTVRNESDADAIAFVVFAPAGEMEGFMRAAGALAVEGSPTLEDVMDVASRHGIEIAGPLPDLAPEAV